MMGLWGGPSSVPLYSCLWAGASRREEETLQSQVGQDKARLPFCAPSSWVRWFECRSPPWETRLVLFFLKVFSKGVAALHCDMHRHLGSCSSHLAAFLLWLIGVKGCGCCMTAGSGLWQFSCGTNLTGLYEQGAVVSAKKGRMWSFLPFSV